MTQPSGEPVAIVGAGLAGLAAAVYLSARNIPVVVLEQKPHAGGRAFSFRDRLTGETIDNGQHVLIEAYSQTLQYLLEIGSADRLLRRRRSGLKFHHPERGFRSFSVAPLPSPFDLLVGIVVSDLLSIPNRFRLLRCGVALRLTNESRTSLQTQTVEVWLRAHGQNDETIRSFWEPLTIAIMNEHTRVASAAMFVHTLRLAFLDKPGGSSLVIPAGGLSDVFIDPAIRFIESRGGAVRCSSRVVSVNVGVAQTGLELVEISGKRMHARAAILAIPPWSFSGELRSIADVPQLPSSPIISIHLWYEKNFMRDAVIGVVGKRVQWIFNRRKIVESSSSNGHVSCVISAANDLVHLSNGELSSIAASDMASVFSLGDMQPTRSIVIREKRATFSPRPLIDKVRPGPQTKFSTIFLAGDWTATGIPGTIEGAILSGIKAASLLKAQIL